MDLQKIFSEVSDFRLNLRKIHLLSDILVICLCGIISGANDFEYGCQKQDFLSEFLDLSNEIPHMINLIGYLDILILNHLINVLVKWSCEILNYLDFYQVNIYGKVLTTAKVGEKKSGICLISAWLSEQNVSLD